MLLEAVRNTVEFKSLPYAQLSGMARHLGLPVKAGDAILFTENLRHGGRSIRSGRTRKSACRLRPVLDEVAKHLHDGRGTEHPAGHLRPLHPGAAGDVPESLNRLEGTGIDAVKFTELGIDYLAKVNRLFTRMLEILA